MWNSTLTTRKQLKAKTPLRRVSRKMKMHLSNDKKDKEAAIKRTGGLCEVCGTRGIEIHHMITSRDKTIRHDPRNHLFVCRPCHDGAHARPKEFKQYLKSILPYRYRDYLTMEIIHKQGTENARTE